MPEPLSQSNITTQWTQGLVSAGTLVYTNHRPNTAYHVRFVSLVNTSGGSGSEARMLHYQTGAVFHSGSAGTGVLDRFPLSCDIAILYNESIEVFVTAGSWDVCVSGFYEPLFLAN